MKFNTEVTVISPTTGERTKWQGPQIEAETFQQAENAAFNAIVYATGENVPREQLSVNMQPPRSLAFRFGYAPLHAYRALEQIAAHLDASEIEEDKAAAILRILGYEVFDPRNPKTIRMKNENLFHPDFVSKLNEAEAIGGVVISYLPKV
jgi:hypothetical protein